MQLIVVQIGSLFVRTSWGAFEIATRTWYLAANLMPDCRITEEMDVIFILSYILLVFGDKKKKIKAGIIF